jgi:subtilisin family serine protease
MWTWEERKRFWEDIKAAIDRPIPTDPAKLYIRYRGLRLLIETPYPRSSSEVLSTLMEVLGPPPERVGSLLRVEPLFSEDDPEELRLFHAAILGALDPEDLEESPYDACYELQRGAGFVSVEPDIAYQHYFSASHVVAAPVGAPTATDKAWALRNMNVDKAWTAVPPFGGAQDGQGASIAHLDTGYVDHTDLDISNFDWARKKDILDPNRDASDPLVGLPGLNPGHGTRTGSVMMSKGGVAPFASNSLSVGTTPPGEITGVAREATYVPVRCILSVIVIYAGDVAQAIRYATKEKCHVTSMSLGGFPAKAMLRAIQDAVRNDVVVVAAAGNKVRTVVWPARYDECIAMAASNAQDAPWIGSSRGPSVDLAAPGEDVWVAEPTRPPHGTGAESGTSYATAHMAGVAALWLAFYGRPYLTTKASSRGHSMQELFRHCSQYSARVPNNWDQTRYGVGIVDVLKLLKTDVDEVSLKVIPVRSLADRVDLRPVLNYIRGFDLPIKEYTVVPLAPYEHELASLELELASRDESEPRPKVSLTLRAALEAAE